MAIGSKALVDKFRYAYSNEFGYVWGKSGQLWTKEDQEKATREQTVKYGARWIGHRVVDCSGLFYWAFKQLGGYMYHGSNTMFDKYCTAKGGLKKGKRTDGKELKPGTALFTGTKEDHGHVGLYIGDGFTIEAKSTQTGVVWGKASDSKWTFWGELKGVNYEDSGSGSGGSEISGTPPTIRRGDKGEYVTAAQAALAQRGYNLGPCGVDGDFGRATEAAVKQFQQDWGLKQDGIVGPATWKALQTSVPNTKMFTATISHLSEAQAEKLKNEYPACVLTDE